MASTHGYTTAANMKIVIPDIEQSGEFDADAEIEVFINRAEAIINSKLAVRYTVPFTGTIPVIITHLTEQIAAYHMLKTEFTQDSINDNEWVNEYKEVRQYLADVASGKEILVDASGDELTERSDIVTTNRNDRDPIFDVDDPLNHNVDPDLTTDIANDRA